MDDYILERTAMPEENVRKAQGDFVFEEEKPLVFQFLMNSFLTCANKFFEWRAVCINFGHLTLIPRTSCM